MGMIGTGPDKGKSKRKKKKESEEWGKKIYREWFIGGREGVRPEHAPYSRYRRKNKDGPTK